MSTKLYVDDSFASNLLKTVAAFSHVELVHILTDQTNAPEALKTKIPALVTEGATTPLTGTHDIAVSLLGGDHLLLGATDPAAVASWVSKVHDEVAPDVQSNDEKKVVSFLEQLNKQLQDKVFLVSNHVTLADLAVFVGVSKLLPNWGMKERYINYLNISRWYDNVQHLKEIRSATHLSKFFVELDRNVPKDIKEVVEKLQKKQEQANQRKQEQGNQKNQEQVQKNQEQVQKKQESNQTRQKKQAHSNQAQQPPQQKATETKVEQKTVQPKPQERGESNQAQKKKGEQQRQQKAQPSKGAEKLDVSLLDIRVGKILSVKEHTAAGAQHLYIEEIDLGEGTPRQVVSGLRNFIPVEQMQNRLVLVLANIKATNFKGVQSAAMVIAASNADHTKVELVDPPEGSKIGERVTFAGYDGEPEQVLNPKKKIFEQLKPDLKTDDTRIATYKGVPFKTSAGVCTVVSLANSGLS